MPEFANKDLAGLAHQLSMSPKRQRLAQLKGIESLLGLVQSNRVYPYDMVCFHITGYRSRRTTDKPGIAGGKLVGDLVSLAEHITRKNAIPVAELDEPYRTYEDVAEDLQVSTKTIRRWRRRGLMGFRATFEDGVARLIYLQSTIDRFVEQNKALVERGASFKQLSAAEKARIVKLARELLSRRRMKLHVAAREIAKQTGRAIETIRYTLRRYDQAHPENALFSGSGMPAAPELHRRIWKAHLREEEVRAIAARCRRSVAEVEQIIREMSARCLKADPVGYIHNELFDAPNADALILDVPRPVSDEDARRVSIPRDLPAYLRSLYEIPLMTPEREVDAFRRYNFLKYKLARCIEALDVCEVSQRQLDEIGELKAQVEALRREIVEANLRLVVSIAKKHVGWSPRFFEVISDGNMSLIRAVEKFDYSRGFKFSTYASWAIMKNYARTIPEEHYRFGRFVTGQKEILYGTADHRAAEGPDLDERNLAEALKAGMKDLTERERNIITSHFGLFGAGPSMTLEEIGKRYGVTKERVRQIERRAIGKIKSALPASVVDLLPE